MRAVRALIRGGATATRDWVCEAMRGGHLAVAELLREAGVEHDAFTLAALGDAAGLGRWLRRAPDTRTRCSCRIL
jgi:hypothetical protein